MWCSILVLRSNTRWEPENCWRGEGDWALWPELRTENWAFGPTQILAQELYLKGPLEAAVCESKCESVAGAGAAKTHSRPGHFHLTLISSSDSNFSPPS